MSEDIFLFAREASVRYIILLLSPVAFIFPAILKASTYRKRYSFVTSQCSIELHFLLWRALIHILVGNHF